MFDWALKSNFFMRLPETSGWNQLDAVILRHYYCSKVDHATANPVTEKTKAVFAKVC